jgi:hypothetical protein
MEPPRDRPENENGDLVEVTPAMIAAGVAELSEKMFGQPMDIVVREVYLAMRSANVAAYKGSDRPANGASPQMEGRRG